MYHCGAWRAAVRGRICRQTGPRLTPFCGLDLNMSAFRVYIKQRIRHVESWLVLPPDEVDWLQVAEDCRWVLAEVESQATLAGVPGAVTACQGLGTNATVEETRRILAECLAACPPEAETNGAMSVRQAAKQLGVSKETVYGMCRDGRLPCTRIGRRIVITPEQLASYQSPLPASVGSLRHLS
jgi:excisionase family DNA binding protein